MSLLITCLCIVAILISAGIATHIKRRKYAIIHYACKQSCEHYQFRYNIDSLKASSNQDYHYQFDYHDGQHTRTGYVVFTKSEVTEIIFDKRSLDPRRNNPLFKSANDMNNVIEFPKKE